MRLNGALSLIFVRAVCLAATALGSVARTDAQVVYRLGLASMRSRLPATIASAPLSAPVDSARRCAKALPKSRP